MKGTIKIYFPEDEVWILESCLNYAYQGEERKAMFIISLYAFKQKWHYKKLLYYLKLMNFKSFL